MSDNEQWANLLQLRHKLSLGAWLHLTEIYNIMTTRPRTLAELMLCMAPDDPKAEQVVRVAGADILNAVHHRG